MLALLELLLSSVTPGVSFPAVHPEVGTAPTVERQLRVPAGILQEGHEEGPEHLRAFVVGSENVEQPPAPLAAVPVGTARADPLRRARIPTVAPSTALCKDEVPRCPSRLEQLRDTNVSVPASAVPHGCRDSRLGAGVVGDLLDDLAVHLIPQDFMLRTQLGDKHSCHLSATPWPGHPQDSAPQ